MLYHTYVKCRFDIRVDLKKFGIAIEMDNELTIRIRRLYAAIDGIEESDLRAFKGKIVATEKHIEFYQDFRAGLTDEELSNRVHSLIYNIASLYDHLRKWADNNGYNKNKVEIAVNNSEALKIIIDLANNDRHGYPPRDGGRSRKSPKLVDLDRVLQLTTGSEPGSGVAVTFGRDGTPMIAGSGSAKVIITGDVIDKDGNRIGDLSEIAVTAVEAWEQLLQNFRSTA